MTENILIALVLAVLNNSPACDAGFESISS